MPKKQSAKSEGRRSTLRSEPPAVLRQIGERIRELRKAKGLSQDRLAYSIPLDRAHIGSIERGIKAPTVLTLLRIADALEVEVGQLFPPMDELRAHIPRRDLYALAPHQQLPRSEPVARPPSKGARRV
jgi:transcriptional regulator with XRE-family HTH domain